MHRTRKVIGLLRNRLFKRYEKMSTEEELPEKEYINTLEAQKHLYKWCLINIGGWLRKKLSLSRTSFTNTSQHPNPLVICVGSEILYVVKVRIIGIVANTGYRFAPLKFGHIYEIEFDEEHAGIQLIKVNQRH